MASMTDYLESALCDHILGQGSNSYAQPATVFVALFTSATGDDGTGTEVADPASNSVGYTRIALGTTQGTGNVRSNAADIDFPVATGGDWGTITHGAIYDAATGGNMLLHGALPQSKTILDGEQFKILAGNLTLTLD